MPSYLATFTPDGGTALAFGLLIQNPGRETKQTANEEMIIGTNDVVIDVIGKAVTKIRSGAIIASIEGLETFEGAVGLQGTLAYTEYGLTPTSVSYTVLFMECSRVNVTKGGVQIVNMEFWIIPTP